MTERLLIRLCDTDAPVAVHIRGEKRQYVGRIRYVARAGKEATPYFLLENHPNAGGGHFYSEVESGHTLIFEAADVVAIGMPAAALPGRKKSGGKLERLQAANAAVEAAKKEKRA